MDAFLSHLKIVFADIISQFALTARLHPLWIGSFLLIGSTLYFLQSDQRKSPRNLLGALDYCLPREFYFSRTAAGDLLLALSGTLIFAMFSYTLANADLVAHRQRMVVFMNQLFENRPARLNRSLASDALWMVWLFTARDFGWFVSHYLFHRVRWLWPIHQVHHSADQLTLLTTFRFHPVEKLVFVFFQGCSLGTAIFIGLRVIDAPPGQIFYFSLPLIALISGPIGLFRHSHIWISFGRWVSLLLISPAMHQIHHSDKPEHCHRNYGKYLAVWDLFFRTLYIPKRNEKPNFGLSDKAEQARFAGFSGLLWLPLAMAVKAGRRRRPGR
jgi:sterol desaturase/sphingolipid hydroxylase (fatty acid hydroxylase superfamily)